jgi:hypothetical protein
VIFRNDRSFAKTSSGQNGTEQTAGFKHDGVSCLQAGIDCFAETVRAAAEMVAPLPFFLTEYLLRPIVVFKWLKLRLSDHLENRKNGFETRRG